MTQDSIIAIISLTSVFLAAVIFGMTYMVKYLQLLKAVNFEEEANELNYEFLSLISPNEEFMYTSAKDGKSYTGCICIHNSPSQRKMYCKFRYSGGVFGLELLKYSDPRFMNVFVLNRSEGDVLEGEPTCSDILTAELELLEVEEKYEEAAILRDAIIKLETLNKK